MWQHFIFCPQTEEKDWAENKTIRASWKNFASIYLWVWEAMKVRVCVMPPCSRATWPEAFGFQVASSSCGTLAPMGLIRWCSSKVIVVLLNSLSHAESDRILTQMLAEDRDRKPAPGTSVLCSRSIHVFRILSFCSFWPIMSTHKELDFFLLPNLLNNSKKNDLFCGHPALFCLTFAQRCWGELQGPSWPHLPGVVSGLAGLSCSERGTRVGSEMLLFGLVSCSPPTPTL